MFVLAVYWVFKTFCHLVCFFICGHSTYLLSAFVVYVAHTSPNRHEFYLRFLRFSVLNILYCFSVSNLAESKLSLLPKLSNVPTKCLLFLPLLSRYIHQQFYCTTYMHHEMYQHNIPLSTINITRSTQFYPQYYDRQPNFIPLSTNNITRGTQTILLFLLTILRVTHIVLLFY